MTPALCISFARDGAALAVRIEPPAPPPVAALMLGRTPEAVAELMPRLFNLCGMAQGLAVRLALGLPVAGIDPRGEILRDHLARLCLHWPRHLDLSPRPLPAAWQNGGADLQAWLWGGDRPRDLWQWLDAGHGAAAVLAAIREGFAPGHAVASPPPLTDPLSLAAQENSPAGRVADDPLMVQAEAEFGRGPLWRALGCVVDLDRFCVTPAEVGLRADGTALVAAARGTYALRARAEGGIVTALARVTPTDHLVAPGGALEQALASLPAASADLMPLVVDILDPCVPVRIREAADA